MTMRFETTASHVDVVVEPTGWRFAEPYFKTAFETLTVLERLNLRRQFEAQVALAKATPTKGDQ